MFGILLDQVLNESAPSTDQISDAIKNRRKIKISYNSGGEGKAQGTRVVDVYAYGLSKSGNAVLRVFQEFGDSSGDNPTFTPGWKTIRVDRINDWEETDQQFNEIPSSSYGKYNPDGDRNMDVVLMMAKMPNGDTDEKGNYIPAGERRLRDMMANTGKAFKISDLRNNYGFNKTGAETSRNMTDDYWKDFEKAEKEAQRNISRRDDRWKDNATNRALYRKDSANTDLRDMRKETMAKNVKGYINPQDLKNTSTVSLGDDFWKEAEKDIQKMRSGDNRYMTANTERSENAADTRNLHRKDSANRILQDLDQY